MRDGWVPQTPDLFAEYLKALYLRRRKGKSKNNVVKVRRRSLSGFERKEVLRKTGDKCHICGGLVEDKWEADHILSFSSGGKHTIDNYLPAHRLCNSYRWDYLPEEFQEILRLGVWLRTQIQNKSMIGRQAAEKYISYENNRITRRKSLPSTNNSHGI